MMTNGFLAIVGAAYLGLGIWCSIQPEKTSKVVGFVLQPGSGQSEFLTVYGGLEFGLGLVFLLPLIRPSDANLVLLVCLLVHGSLVTFRTVGFVLFRGIESTTFSLAGVEWLIFLASAILFARSK